MLQDRYETDKMFERIYQPTNEMDPVLVQIDTILEDKELYQLIRRDFAKRYPQKEVTGRKSTPVEVLLRMLTVKRLYGLSYEQTEYQVQDSLVLRQFCRVYLHEVPDDTTLIRWANLVEAETLAAYNQQVTQLAADLKVTKGRKLRTDGIVVETHCIRLAPANYWPTVCGSWVAPCSGPSRSSVSRANWVHRSFAIARAVNISLES